MDAWDAVIIGSGHNALVAGAFLARDGWRVLVLEERDRPGGLVRTEELTLPGFKHDVYASAHPLFTAGPAYAALAPDLAGRGLEYRRPRYWSGVATPAGSTVLSSDPAENLAEAERLGDGPAFAKLLKDFEPFVEPVFGLLGAELSSRESARVIGKLFRDRGFAQLFTLTARDLLTQSFTSPVLKAALAPWALHLGRGPDEANSGIWVLLCQIALTLAGMPGPAVPRTARRRAVRRAAVDSRGGRAVPVRARLFRPASRAVGAAALRRRTAAGGRGTAPRRRTRRAFAVSQRGGAGTPARGTDHRHRRSLHCGQLTRAGGPGHRAVAVAGRPGATAR
ncbi:NAD(P)-binding protein [Amycolatopsis sp. NEAU-NG30]|uniref:NAD(P)-binding protein n=1 Tax=Amycolatopsis melonis TaxID=3156488 RepID=A0ABV0LE75_9PSEU